MKAILQTAAARMGGELSERLRAVTENISNSTIPGYRKCIVTQPSFDSLLQNRIQGTSVATDFSQGSLKATGNPLDFAIEGDAYFEVTKDDLTCYTKNGQFHIAPDNTLVTFTGFRVNGESGPITIPSDVAPDSIQVAADGSLSSGNRNLGKLKLVSFENPRSLNRTATTLFSTSDETTSKTPENITVTNRMLESSNAALYEEMAELIQLTKAFELNQRMIRSRDGVESQMIKTMV